MSVVLRMLQNLDARGAAPSVPGLSPGPAATPASARWRLPLIAATGLAAIALTAFGDWPAALQLDGTAPEVKVPAPVASPTATAAPAASAVAPGEAPTGNGEHKRNPTKSTTAIAPPLPQKPATDAARLARAPTTARESAIAARTGSGASSTPMARVEMRVSAGHAESRAQLAYRQAVTTAQAGQRQSALRMAHESIALDPRHAAARQLVAVLEHELGDTDRATSVLRDGLAIDARQSTLALLLARLLVTQGSADAALTVLDKHGVVGSEADGLRAGVWAQRGEFKTALVAYESALRHQPGNPIWWLGLGVALESDGQAQRARQAYGRAQSLGLPRDDLAAFVDQRLRALD